MIVTSLLLLYKLFRVCLRIPIIDGMISKMSHIPFYDYKKTYEENYDKGPFGAFASDDVYEEKIEPRFAFLGQKIYSPFGIPAGPLINSKYIKAALEKGFDVVTYKTIRSGFFPCHPFPNVVPVDAPGELHPDQTPRLTIKESDTQPLSITNSFGVPSKDVAVWQEDMKKALSYVKKGQLMIGSFMGTVRKNQTQEEFISDFVEAAKLVCETGVEVLEMNLSCPNIGNEGLVCYNLSVSEQVCKAVRHAIGSRKLILKIGYYKNEKDLEQMADIASNYADAVAAINTLQVEVVDTNGQQALPGENRLKSGVCGSAIKWAGLSMVKKLSEIKKRHGYTFAIVGMGGVMTVSDFFEFRDAGADLVQSATAAMWNPYFAQEIKKVLYTR